MQGILGACFAHAPSPLFPPFCHPDSPPSSSEVMSNFKGLRWLILGECNVSSRDWSRDEARRVDSLSKMSVSLVSGRLVYPINNSLVKKTRFVESFITDIPQKWRSNRPFSLVINFQTHAFHLKTPWTFWILMTIAFQWYMGLIGFNQILIPWKYGFSEPPVGGCVYYSAARETTYERGWPYTLVTASALY